MDANRLSLISSPHNEEMEAGGSGGTKFVQEEDKRTKDEFQEMDIGPVSDSLVDFDN